MKKLWVIFPVLLIAGLVMMGCPNGGGDGDEGEKVTITFNAKNPSNSTAAFPDGSTTWKTTIAKGAKTAGPPIPVWAGHNLTSWKSINNVVFSPAAAQNVTITYLAQWEEGDPVVFKASLPFGEKYTEGDNNVWDFEEDAIEEITAAEAEKTGHKIRLYFTAPAGKETYGIGSFGVVDGDTFNLPGVPSAYTPGTTVAGAAYDFYLDAWVSWALAAIEGDLTLSVMAYTTHEAILVDAELWEPEEDIVPPEVPSAPEPSESKPMLGYLLQKTIVTTEGSGLGDIALGKGWIPDDDYDAIAEAVDGSRLRFYFRLQPGFSGGDRNGWGLAVVGTNSAGIELKGVTADENGEFYVDQSVKSILEFAGVSDLGKIFVNAYGNGAVITLCELWSPDPDYVKPEGFILKLGANSTYGWQSLLKDIDDEPLFIEDGILDGDEYTLTVTFTSDIDITTQLQVVLVNDNPWMGLSGYLEIGNNITADTEVIKTLVIPATGQSTTLYTAALAINTNAEQATAPTLTFTEFTFTRTKKGEAIDPNAEVESIPKPGFTTQAITIDTSGEGMDPATGKGKIVGDDLTAVKAAGEWSVLRFYYKIAGNYHIGQIEGGAVQWNLYGISGSLKYHDVKLKDLGSLTAATQLFVNIWGGAEIAKCELLTTAATYTKTGTLSLSASKNIEGAEYTKVTGAAEGSFLRINFTGGNGSNGGIGKIAEKGSKNVEIIDTSYGYWDVDVATVLEFTDGDNWIPVNFWGSGMTLGDIELWAPGN